MLTILVEGMPIFDKSQSLAEAQLVERLLESEVTLGPDLTQVRIQGYVWRSAPATVVVVTCSN